MDIDQLPWTRRQETSGSFHVLTSHALMSKSKAMFPEGRGHAGCAYRSTGRLWVCPGSSTNPARQGLSKWKRDQFLPEYSSAQLRIPGGPPTFKRLSPFSFFWFLMS